MQADILKVDDSTFVLSGMLCFDSVLSLDKKAKLLLYPQQKDFRGNVSQNLQIINGKTNEHCYEAKSASVKSITSTNIYIDCDKVRYCDSAGLAMIVAWKRLLCQRGGNLRVRHPTLQMQQLLNLTDLSNFLCE